MKRLIVFLCLCACVTACAFPLPRARGEGAALREDPRLSAAFSLLEEGNPFTERYNRLTGAGVRARFACGVPYVWGGTAASHVFAREPDYTVLPSYSSSPIYYEAGRKYLCGFDCAGFLRWVLQEAGIRELPKLTEVLDGAGTCLWSQRSADLPPLGKIASTLDVGDVLVVERGTSRHAAMYVGTLRMYGYTEEEVPSLAEWLDHPLVVHSTVNAQISDRFLDLIEHGLPKYRCATVTDGGVCVSLLCDSRVDAPFTVNQQKQDTSYFPLPDGTWLTVLPFEPPDRFRWIRP